MRYAQINSKYVCGIDLHAREMYACVMNERVKSSSIVICEQTLINSRKRCNPFYLIYLSELNPLICITGWLTPARKIISLSI